MRSSPLARIVCLASLLVATRAMAQTAGQQVPSAPAEQQPTEPKATAGAQAPPPAAQPGAAPLAAPQSPSPQTPAVSIVIQTPPHAVDPVKARYNVQVMEAVLERAVRYAAGQMNRRLQAVSPDLLQLSGAARARGFRLPGYGVFFDVDVPAALRHTMGWTLRLMQQSDQNVQRALSALKQSVTELDPKQRAQADEALKLLETRFQPPPRPRIVGPLQDQPSGEGAPTDTVIASSSDAAPPSTTLAVGGGAATAVSTSVAAAPAPAETVSASAPASAAVSGSSAPTVVPTASTPTASAPPGSAATAVAPTAPVPSAASTAAAPTATAGTAPASNASAPAAPASEPTADDRAWAQNPDLAYEMEVRDALVSAMLEYGSTLSLGADEYLTVAARDSENIVMPGDLSETVTVLMRIKGSDLSEYKAGRLTEADARRRVEVREF